MLKTPLLLIVSLLTLTAPATLALAKAKIIHVPDVLATARMPNPPAGEDEAAGLRGKGEGLPMVLRLQKALKPAAPSSLPGLPGTAIAECNDSASNTSAGANPLYAPADLIYGGRIAFPPPAWDGDRFLPTAGWSEQPGLWASHVR